MGCQATAVSNLEVPDCGRGEALVQEQKARYSSDLQLWCAEEVLEEQQATRASRRLQGPQGKLSSLQYIVCLDWALRVGASRCLKNFVPLRRPEALRAHQRRYFLPESGALPMGRPDARRALVWDEEQQEGSLEVPCEFQVADDKLQPCQFSDLVLALDQGPVGLQPLAVLHPWVAGVVLQRPMAQGLERPEGLVGLGQRVVVVTGAVGITSRP